MALTTRTQISREVNNWYDKRLLRRAIPRFVHNRWAQISNLPNTPGTRTIKFRRYANLSAATTPLTEGLTPTGSQLSQTEVTVDILQYGDFITITDVLKFESPDQELTIATRVLGTQAGDTMDQITRDIIAAGTSVIYPSAGYTARTDVTSTDFITKSMVRQAVRLLKNNLALKMTSMVNPSTGFNTKPIPEAFIGIVHPNIAYTLKELPGFTKVENYSSKMNVMDGEIGTLDEVRFVETTNAKVFTGGGSGSIDVYGTLILGTDAYGVSRFSTEALTNIVKLAQNTGTSDPLNQRNTSGWKATHATVILNNEFMARVESASE